MPISDIFEFSELLKRYLRASGYTIYQVSKMTGVNRTSIQKALKGERVPQAEAVEALASYLNLTASERENLMEAYEMARCGRNLYIQRRYVKSMIQSIAFSYEAAKKSVRICRQAETVWTGGCEKLYFGKYEISRAVETLLKKEVYEGESPCVRMSLSSEKGFYRGLFALMDQTDFIDIRVRQIVSFVKNPVESENGNHNLKILAEILPHILIRGANYEVYQQYVNYVEDPDSGFCFTNFLLFTNCLLLLSSDYETAWLEADSGVLAYFRKNFTERVERSTRLVRQPVDVMMMGQHFVDCDKDVEDLYWIEYQPCLIPLCSRALIERVMCDDVPARGKVAEMLERRTEQFHAIRKRIGIFNADSLAEFAETGRLTDIPAGYARPFTLGERLYLLEQLFYCCKTDQEILRAINPEAFPISRHISIAVHGKKELTLYLFDLDSGEYHCIEIGESTLVNAFFDFISYITESKWVYSKEDTLKMIGHYLEVLKKVLSKNDEK